MVYHIRHQDVPAQREDVFIFHANTWPPQQAVPGIPGKRNSDIKKAKNFVNGIQSFMLEIQLDQVNTVHVGIFLKRS